MTETPPPTTATKSIPWWLWPHVLSLEAPLVAVLFQRLLMHAHGIRFTPMLDVGLALVCWLVYLIDRTLDTFAVKSAAALDVRHAFYFRHRRVLLWLVIPAAVVVLAWMALFVIPEGVLWQAAGLALLVALYLASWSAQGSRVSRDLLIMGAGMSGILLISRLPAPTGFRFVLSLMVLGVMALSFLRQLDIRLGHLLPKEMTAALLFALGCTTSTRFFSMPDGLLQPLVECGLLALLFACNLHGISAHERHEKGRHATLVLVTLIFSLGTVWYVHAGVLSNTLAIPAQVVLGALGLHAVLQLVGRRLSPEAHHVLADLALVVPLLLAWA